jgi:hypothetical protein
MDIITTREQLIDFRHSHGLRMDWHEPDEQYVTARVEGNEFDNAGFWPAGAGGTVELHVVFSVIDDTDHDDSCNDRSVCGHQTVTDVAAVNLATLCAWATGYTVS